MESVSLYDYRSACGEHRTGASLKAKHVDTGSQVPSWAKDLTARVVQWEATRNEPAGHIKDRKARGGFWQRRDPHARLDAAWGWRHCKPVVAQCRSIEYGRG